MRLRQIVLENFKCYEHLEIDFDDLTIVIGENDVGKSVIFEAIDCALGSTPLSEPHFRCIPPFPTAKSCSIVATFALDEDDTIPESLRREDGASLSLRKSARTGEPTVAEVLRLDYANDRLRNFGSLLAPEQRQLLEELGIPPAAKKDGRIEQLQHATEQGQVALTEQWTRVTPAELRHHLPRFFSISSAEFRHPDLLVQRTLKEAAEEALRPTNEDGVPTLIQPAQKLDAIVRTALEERIATIKQVVGRSLPGLRDLDVNPVIDFARCVTSVDLIVDVGDGTRLVEALGEGNKRKLWMGLLEWQSSITPESKTLIRGYDEPDVNLHYDAQRKLYSSIAKHAEAGEQVIIATHSVQLIDRAPSSSIRLVTLDANNKRQVTTMQGADDADFRTFYDTVGRSVGLTNSALLYERAFLFVEGESEATALPILYANLYGRPMAHDGIVLVTLFGCGAAKSILKVLQRNKESQTVMLLDTDCTHEESSARLTPDTLKEIGYSDQFLERNCIYIGIKEFEDSFEDTDILQVLCTAYPRMDGHPWAAAHLPSRDGGKFSAELMDVIRAEAVKGCRSLARKPAFAEFIGKQCTSLPQVPEAVRHALQLVRTISGVEGE